MRTVGRFVWEHFSEDDVAPAQDAFDVIYSVTDAEHERYGRMGIEPVRVHMGIHPELLAIEPQRDGERITLVWPGSFMGRRKPLDEALEAFGRVERPATSPAAPRPGRAQGGQARRKRRKNDPRIEVLLEDQPTAEHLQSFADCDVCLTPSRWEGLGLPLYEATAFGMPIITNDDPPMNEVVTDGLNGILIASHPEGTTRSGIDSKDPDVDDMARAIEAICDDALRAKLSAGALEVRERLPWSRTVEDLEQPARDRGRDERRRGARPRPLRCRRAALGDDAAAADARRASRAGDPARDALHPGSDQGMPARRRPPTRSPRR